MAGIETHGSRKNLVKGGFYTSGGAWPGNDTIWRMVFDLQRIILYGVANRPQLAADRQRQYLAIVDGVVGGEGNGPLQPLPVDIGVLIAGQDPFAVDAVMAALMGFKPDGIPCLRRRTEFGAEGWGAFGSREPLCRLEDEGIVVALDDISPVKKFLPPPGWSSMVSTS
jgi:hypothetical protein